jgi:hypothetical protein
VSVSVKFGSIQWSIMPAVHNCWLYGVCVHVHKCVCVWHFSVCTALYQALLVVMQLCCEYVWVMSMSVAVAKVRYHGVHLCNFGSGVCMQQQTVIHLCESVYGRDSIQ